MVEDCNKLDTKHWVDYNRVDELYNTANSLFCELFGVKLESKESQSLTQQELFSFV